MATIEELIAAEQQEAYDDAMKAATRVAKRLGRQAEQSEVLEKMKSIVDGDETKTARWNNRKVDPEGWRREEDDIARHLRLGGKTTAEMMRMSECRSGKFRFTMSGLSSDGA